MSAVAIFNAYEESLAAVRRWQKQAPTSDEKIQFLQAAIRSFTDAAQVAQFKTDVKDVAAAAVKAQKAFDSADQYFQTFISQHGQQFPGLAVYRLRWLGYKTRWTNLVRTSRDFASKMSASYKEYDETLLQMIDSVKTKEDMQKAAAALERFSSEKPSDIPSNFSQQFLDLKRDVDPFLTEFSSYLDQLGAVVAIEIIILKMVISMVQKRVDEYTQMIDLLLKAVEAASWMNLVSPSIAYILIMPFVIYRASLQQEVNTYRQSLDETVRKLQGLVRIKTEFGELGSAVFDSLYLFSTIWAQFHSEALQFAEILRKLPTVEYPTEFRLRVDLARKTAVPLQAALQEYANEVSRSL